MTNCCLTVLCQWRTFSGAYRVGSVAKNPPTVRELQEMQVQSLCQEDPLEEGTTTHSSILACRIPWTEDPGGLKGLWGCRVRHNRSDLAHMHTYHQVDHLSYSKVYSSLVLSTFAVFCSHHHCAFPELYHYPKHKGCAY